MSVNFITNETYQEIPKSGIQRSVVKLSDGTLIHFFKGSASGSGVYVVYSSDNGITWSTSTRVTTVITNSFCVYKRKDDAIFIAYDYGYPGVLALRKVTLSGGTFTVGSEKTVSVGTDLFTVSPSLFIRETDSQIWILFRRQISSSETRVSYVTTDDEGATFSSKTDIYEVNSGFAVFYLSVIQDSNDYPFICYEYAGKIYSISWNGSSWDAPVNIDNSVTDYGDDICLTKTRNNKIYLSVGQSSYTTGKTRVYRYSGGSWSSALFSQSNGGFNFNSFTPLITSVGDNVYLFYANSSNGSIVLNALYDNSDEFINIRDAYISSSGTGRHIMSGVIYSDDVYLYGIFRQSGTYDTYCFVSDVSIALNKKVTKRFAHKIYDRDGNYITTWRDDVINTPSFKWKINGGMGSMKIQLARKFTDFGEEVDVGLNFRIKTVIEGKDEKSGTQIFDGIITSYSPSLNEQGDQIIDVWAVSQSVTLENKMIKDGSNTTITYSSQAPDAILKDLIDKYNDVIDYQPSSIEATGTTVSYTFQYQSYLEAINKTLELCPSYWYWYIDGLSNIFLKSRNLDVVNHELLVGKHINWIEAEKNIDNLYNAVYFKGGGSPPLYKLYSRTTSQTTYGVRDKKIQDERVTVADTAEKISTKFLDERDHPISVTRVKVIDNSISADGYDIESLRPGDVVKVVHPKYETSQTLWDVAMFDVDFWDFNVIYSIGIPSQIIDIEYNFDHAILTLSATIEDTDKRIEDINRNLTTVRSEDIPSAPS